MPGVDALLPDLSLLLRRLMAQAVHPLGQGGHLLLGLTGLLLQGVQFLQGLVQLRDVPFQHRIWPVLLCLRRFNCFFRRS